MVAKICLIALSCIFIVQIEHAHCKDPVAVAAPETQSQTEFDNEMAKKTINTILRHLRISMTHPVSAPVIQYIATAARELLTSEVGQKNTQHLIDFIEDLLMDPNTLVSMQTFHKRLVQLAATDRSAPIVLETAAIASKRILDEPQLMQATEGLVEGFNKMLDGMTPAKLRSGISRVKNLTKLAALFKPIIGHKVPTLDKLKRSQSDSAINYSYPGKDDLQVRDMGWINGPALNMRTTNNAETINTNI